MHLNGQQNGGGSRRASTMGLDEAEDYRTASKFLGKHLGLFLIGL
jgi:hypothetical protein